jgi:hypothetical protein
VDVNYDQAAEGAIFFMPIIALRFSGIMEKKVFSLFKVKEGQIK